MKIGDKDIGLNHPTYFIADIGSNHEGSLERALYLIELAAESGADAAKFQHHRADMRDSDFGYRSLGGQLSHQANWNGSVYDVCKKAETPWEWTPQLAKKCEETGIHFFSTPYDLEAIDMLDPFSPAHKIGSGDITYTAMLKEVAKKGKPVLLATGASTMQEVKRAVDTILPINEDLILMQCNTNYTASDENYDNLNIKVLETYGREFPGLVFGLSDHTQDESVIVGAVALGARTIERHFTDDTTRSGPDHPFAMDPKNWKRMVDATRTLERALGNGEKTLQENERETVVVQRRCLRLAYDIPAGTKITEDMLIPKRPAPEGSIKPFDLELVLETETTTDISKGDYLTPEKLLAKKYPKTD